MTIRCIAALLLLALAQVLAGSAGAQSLNDQALYERALAAKEADLEAEPVTFDLIAEGNHPARTARAVAAAYNSCEGTREAVKAAIAADQQAVESVVSAVANVDGCGCSADAMWSRSRLEDRLRPDQQTLLVALSDACSCVTAVVEAAVEQAPERADQIIQAGIEAMQDPPVPVDSVGRRGVEFEETWGQGLTGTNWFRRRAEVCEGDDDDLDEFDAGEEWAAVSGPDIGRHTHGCDDDDDDRAEGLSSLIISEFAAGDGSAVEIYNGTGDDVTLEDVGYRLTVHYAADRPLSHTTRLQGEIASGETFLIAAADAPPPIVAQANQVVPGLHIGGGDTVTLHRRWSEENCECARGVAGGAVRGSENSSTEADRLRNAIAAQQGDGICAGPIITILEQPPGPILFVQRPEDQTEPISVDPIASPN